MKKIVSIIVCISLLLALSGCSNRHEKIMKEAIAYAEDNTELLRSCAKELQATISEMNLKKPGEKWGYRIEPAKGSRLRLYDWIEESETEIQSELCREVLNGGVVQNITLHYKNGALSVEFSCGGYGMGANTGYYQITYISSGKVDDLQFYDDKMTYIEKDKGYFGTETGGDNTFFYYQIAEDIIYSYAHF